VGHDAQELPQLLLGQVVDGGVHDASNNLVRMSRFLFITLLALPSVCPDLALVEVLIDLQVRTTHQGMVREDEPQRPYCIISANDEIALLVEVPLVKFVRLDDVCWLLSFIAYLFEGREHLISGSRIGRPESALEPILQHSDGSPRPDDDLAIPSLLLNFVWHFILEEFLVNVVRHHLVQRQDEIIELGQCRPHQKAELPRAILLERLSE